MRLRCNFKSAFWGVISIPFVALAQPPATPTPEPTPMEIATPIPSPTATPEPQLPVVTIPDLAPTPAPEVKKYPPTPADDTYLQTSEQRDKISEFKELSFSLRPGFGKVVRNPGGFKDPALSLGIQISYFLHRYVAINIPYTFTRYSGSGTTHRAGGGPLVRYLDTGIFRGEVDGSLDYVRAAGGNHLGWSAGVDLTMGWRKAHLRPFLGPFFRYDMTYLPGPNLRGYTIGLGLTLTDLADLD